MNNTIDINETITQQLLPPFDLKVMLCPTVGRRKAATARVHCKKGSGKIIVNGRDFLSFFKIKRYLHNTRKPLELAIEQDSRFAELDIYCNTNGGGITGQSEAIRLAIARKIVELSSFTRPSMRSSGYLTCDSRKVESKKYGQHKARRRCQYAKR